MSSRKVVYARLQTNAYVIGAGELGTVLPSQGKTLEHLVMTTEDLGLMVSFTYRGVKKELLVPYANVILMELAPEEKVVSLKVAKA